MTWEMVLALLGKKEKDIIPSVKERIGGMRICRYTCHLIDARDLFNRLMLVIY